MARAVHGPGVDARPAWGPALALALCLALATGALAAPPANAVPPASPASAPSPPGLPEQWTPGERWAWEKIRRGEAVVMEEFLAQRPGLPPGQPTRLGPGGWPAPEAEARRLGAGFLREVLLHEPWRGAIGHNGVKISGAYFAELVDLTSAELGKDLWLEGCWFAQGFSADYMKAGRGLSLEGSLLPNATLCAARIEGAAVFSLARVRGRLVLTGLKVGGALYFDGGHFNVVELPLAEVGGPVSLAAGTRLEGLLDLSTLKAGGHVRLRGGSLFQVDLENARVAGVLDLCGAEFSGPTMNLRGARVAAVVSGGLEDWPALLDLNRFEYGYLDCPGQEGLAGAAPTGQRAFAWRAKEVTQWLGRQPVHARLPYEQAAKVLREAGQPLEASRVIFAGKVRALGEAWQQGDYPRAAWMTALLVVVGFGEGYYQLVAALWVGLLVLAVLALVRGPAGRAACPAPEGRRGAGAVLDDLIMSIDLIVPFLKIGGRACEISLPAPQRYYLALLRVVGLGLASFILAGLAGLIK